MEKLKFYYCIKHSKGGKILKLKFIRKVVVLIVITSFIGTSILPGISESINKELNHNDDENLNISNDIDWWPKFRHDLNNTGYSETKGPSTNDILWNYTFTSGQYTYTVRTSPALYDFKVYVGDGKGNLQCFQTYDGKKLWNIRLAGTCFNSPTIYNDKIYICSGSSLFCINLTHKIIEWGYRIGNIPLYSSPVVYEGKVYQGSNDESIYCLDAIDGNKIWDYKTGGTIYTTPAIYDDRLYIKSSRNVYCLDTNNGDEIWISDIGETLAYSSPAIYNNKLYIGTKGIIYCLDIDTSDIIWNYETNYNWTFSSPAIAYENIFIGSDDGYNKNNGGLYCLNANDGTKIWDFPIYGEVLSSPVVADGKVYIASKDKLLFCLNASSGTEIWNYTFGRSSDGPIYSSPSVVNGRLFIGSGDGNIYCFGKPNNPPNIPSTPIGEIKCKIGIEYTYSTNTTDLDGDKVWYKWRWGDGSSSELLGPYNSGEICEGSHIWDEKDDYEIKVKAEDIYGAESDWSKLEISMPKNKVISSPFIKFLENHPRLFPILRYFFSMI